MCGPQGTGPTNALSWHLGSEGTQGPLTPLWHFPKLALWCGPACPASFSDPARGRAGAGLCKGQLFESPHSRWGTECRRGHCSKSEDRLAITSQAPGSLGLQSAPWWGWGAAGGFVRGFCASVSLSLEDSCVTAGRRLQESL